MDHNVYQKQDSSGSNPSFNSDTSIDKNNFPAVPQFSTSFSTSLTPNVPIPYVLAPELGVKEQFLSVVQHLRTECFS